MNRGSGTDWNLVWMKSRMEEARASPSGPVVRVSQFRSIDISSVCKSVI